MAKLFKADSVDTLTLDAYNEILENGISRTSRNGKVRYIKNAVLELTNPQARYLSLQGRNNSPAALIAESFWFLAGRDKLDGIMNFFLKRAVDYSDDGETWRGAYGPRIYKYDQLQDAIDTLSESFDSRHAVIQILLPELDSKSALKEVYDLESTKDRPCNNEIVMSIHWAGDGKYQLDMNVYQRSGDALWGALNINIFQFTMLQEMVAGIISKRTGETVIPGTYTAFVTNLHLYDDTNKQAFDATVFNDMNCVIHKNLMTPYGRNGQFKMFDLGTIDDQDKLKSFMNDICDLFDIMIKECCDGNHDKELEAIDKLFKKFVEYEISPYDDQMLFNYVSIVASEIITKKGGTSLACVHDKRIKSWLDDAKLYKTDTYLFEDAN